MVFRFSQLASTDEVVTNMHSTTQRVQSRAYHGGPATYYGGSADEHGGSDLDQIVQMWHGPNEESKAEEQFLWSCFRVLQHPISLLAQHDTQEFADSLDAIERLRLLPDGWDDEAAVRIDPTSIDRAKSVLQRLADSDCWTGPTQEPGVSPTRDGGIDIYWNARTENLLIHVPPGEQPVEFAGERSADERILGLLEPHGSIGHLVAWLVNR